MCRRTEEENTPISSGEQPHPTDMDTLSVCTVSMETGVSSSSSSSSPGQGEEALPDGLHSPLFCNPHPPPDTSRNKEHNMISKKVGTQKENKKKEERSQEVFENDRHYDEEGARKTQDEDEGRHRKREAKEDVWKPYLQVKRPETPQILLPAPCLGVLGEGESSGPSGSSCATLRGSRCSIGKDFRGQGAQGAENIKGINTSLYEKNFSCQTSAAYSCTPAVPPDFENVGWEDDRELGTDSAAAARDYSSGFGKNSRGNTGPSDGEYCVGGIFPV